MRTTSTLTLPKSVRTSLPELQPQEGLEYLLVWDGERAIGGIGLDIQAGAIAFAGPPVWHQDMRPHDARTSLFRHLQARLETEDVAVCFALLAPGAQASAQEFREAGFAHFSDVSLLSLCSLDGLPQDDGPELGLECLQPGNNEPLFVKTIESTFLDSQEAAAQQHLWTAPQVLEVLRGRPGHQPALWHLASIGSRVAGVVLLAAVEGGQALEVQYVGIVPDFRGRRLGRALIAKALKQAWGPDVREARLTVDAANHPARRVYSSLGFSAITAMQLLFYDRRG